MFYLLIFNQLFYCYGFCQVTWLVHITAFCDGDMIGEEL